MNDRICQNQEMKLYENNFIGIGSAVDLRYKESCDEACYVFQLQRSTVDLTDDDEDDGIADVGIEAGPSRSRDSTPVDSGTGSPISAGFLTPPHDVDIAVEHPIRDCHVLLERIMNPEIKDENHNDRSIKVLENIVLVPGKRRILDTCDYVDIKRPKEDPVVKAEILVDSRAGCSPSRVPEHPSGFQDDPGHILVQEIVEWKTEWLFERHGRVPSGVVKDSGMRPTNETSTSFDASGYHV